MPFIFAAGTCNRNEKDKKLNFKIFKSENIKQKNACQIKDDIRELKFQYRKMNEKYQKNNLIKMALKM